jgi:hypothetical protein
MPGRPPGWCSGLGLGGRCLVGLLGGAVVQALSQPAATGRSVGRRTIGLVSSGLGRYGYPCLIAQTILTIGYHELGRKGCKILNKKRMPGCSLKVFFLSCPCNKYRTKNRYSLVHPRLDCPCPAQKHPVAFCISIE